jgi:hypothetical protein
MRGPRLTLAAPCNRACRRRAVLTLRAAAPVPCAVMHHGQTPAVDYTDHQSAVISMQAAFLRCAASCVLR